MSDPFNKPQQLINWSKAAVAGAEALTRDFFVKENFPMSWEVEHSSESKLLVMRLKAPIPDGIERLLTEAINNTKNSFDQTLAKAIDLVGGDSNNIHYPWCDDPGKSFQNKFVHPKSRKILIPSRFIPIIKHQNPFPTGTSYVGGNDLIRQIAKYANRKHSLGLSLDCGIPRGERKVDFETREGSIDLFDSTKWNKSDNSVCFARVRGDVPHFHLNARVAFRFCIEGPTPLGETNVLDAMHLFIDHAQRVLDDFSHETGHP